MTLSRIVTFLLCLILLSWPLDAAPKPERKSAPPSEPAASMNAGQAIAMKEKSLPPTGAHYVYIDAKTPKYIIEALGKKGLQAAFLFDQGQGGWLREAIPALRGTEPLIFLRGGLEKMEAVRLKETLEFFDYNVTLIHLKLAPGDTIDALPVANITVVERRKEKERTSFVMTRGKQVAETATLLSVLDERDLDDPFGVAGGLHFAKYGIRFINLDEGADAKLPPADRTVLFWRSEKNIRKFIEK